MEDVLSLSRDAAGVFYSPSCVVMIRENRLLIVTLNSDTNKWITRLVFLHKVKYQVPPEKVGSQLNGNDVRSQSGNICPTLKQLLIFSGLP